MKKIVVQIDYDNPLADFTALDIQRALEHLFGLNNSFKVDQAKFLEKNPNKRLAARVSKSFPLFYRQGGEKENLEHALSKNISGEGIKILSSSFLAPQKHLTLHIPLPKDTAAVGARVIWCLKSEDSRGFEAGLQFLELSENLKHNLNYFLNRQ